MYNKILDTFLILADTGSFSKAAEKLFISHTAVIKQINQLEQEVAIQLVHRSQKGVQLTPAGEIFYQEAKQLIKAANQALEKVRATQNQVFQTIKVGTSTLFPYSAFMSIWDQVSDDLEKYHLQMVPFEDGPKFMDLLGNTVDIMVGAFDDLKHSDKTETYMLGEYHFGIALPRRHPLFKRQSISFADLEGDFLMIMEAGTSPINDHIRHYLNRHYPYIELINIQPQYRLDTFNQVVENNQPLLALDSWQNVHPDITIIPLKENFTIPYGIVYQKENQKAADFVQQLGSREKT